MMSRRRLNRRLFVALAAAIVGCGSDQDAELPTSELGIQVFGIVGEGEVRVSVTLTTRTSDGDQLSQIHAPDGDRLIARLGGAESVLEPALSESQTPVHLGAVAGDSGTLEVALERGAGIDAPASTVELPAPFDLTAPPASHTRGEPLTIEWTLGVADTIRVLLAGTDCVAGSEVRFDEDLGTATVPAEAFDATPTAPAGPCTASLQVDRLRDGAADPAFGRGGRVEAVITRIIELEIEGS
jgi:hypothetical protein